MIDNIHTIRYDFKILFLLFNPKGVFEHLNGDDGYQCFCGQKDCPDCQGD